MITPEQYKVALRIFDVRYWDGEDIALDVALVKLIESLRNVARAAQVSLDSRDYTSHIGSKEAVSLYEALDALPAWVLDTEDESD